MPQDRSQFKHAQDPPLESGAESAPESRSIASAGQAASQKLGQEAFTKSKVEPLQQAKVEPLKQAKVEPLQQAKLFGEGIVSGLALNSINGATQFSNESFGTNFKAIHLGAQSEIDSSIAGNVGKMIGTTALFIGLALATKKVTSLSPKMLGSAALSESVAFGTAGAIQGGLLTPTQKDLSGSSFFLARGGEALLGSGSAVLGAQGTRVAKLFQASAPSLGVTGSRLLSVGAEGVFNGGLGAGTAHAYSYMQTGKWASKEEVANSAILSAGIGLGASALSFHKGAAAVDSASSISDFRPNLQSKRTAISQHQLESKLAAPMIVRPESTPNGHSELLGFVDTLPDWKRESYLKRHTEPGRAFISFDHPAEPQGFLTRDPEIAEIPEWARENASFSLAKDAKAARQNGKATEANEDAADALEFFGLGEGPNYDRALLDLHDGSGSSREQSRKVSQAVKIFEQAFGLEDPRVIDTFKRVVSSRGRSPLLEPFYGRIVDSAKVRFGPDSPEVADALLNLADFQYGQRLYDRAISSSGASAAIRERNFGSTSAAYEEALTRQGLALFRNGDLRKAEPILQRSLENSRNYSDGPKMANRLNDLSDFAFITGRKAKAQQLLERALQIDITEPGDFSFERQSTLRRLADVHLHTGKIKDAMLLYDLSLEPSSKSWPNGLTGKTDVDDAITGRSNPYLDSFRRLIFDSNDRFKHQILCRKYSWAIPNEKALKTIEDLGPIVEIGAGSGYWAALLRARGTDVVAFDKYPIESGSSWHGGADKSWTEVLKGDERSVAKYTDRTLMLSCPPPEDPMAFNALQAFKGDTLIYIGGPAPRKGAHDLYGDLAFHQELRDKWKAVERVNLPQWPGRDYSLFVYRRRQTDKNA